jgi:hypothetical protein
MPSNKRLKSVSHSIAHHAVSALSYVHPHLRRACDAIGLPCAHIDLKAEDPCPEVFQGNEPLRLSLGALKGKFQHIVTAEGFTPNDIEAVNLFFYFTPEFPDDYCSICEAEVVSASGKAYRSVVDYYGATRKPNQRLQSDCLKRWRAIGNR